MLLNGKLGLAGWRYIFLVEGTMPILLSGLVWWLLPASPLTATFLSPAERDWLWQSVHGRAEVELGQAMPTGRQQLQGQQWEDDEEDDGDLAQQGQERQQQLQHGGAAAVGAAAGQDEGGEGEAAKLWVDSSKKNSSALDLTYAHSAAGGASVAEGGLARGAVREGVCDRRIWFLGGIMALVEFGMT